MKTIGADAAIEHARKATNFAKEILKEVDNDNKDTFAKYARVNFLAGVEWLLEDMGWKSVDDELPENKLIYHTKWHDNEDIEMSYLCTDDVLVLLDSGKMYKTKRISFPDGEWKWNISICKQEEIVYWREIP